MHWMAKIFGAFLNQVIIFIHKLKSFLIFSPTVQIRDIAHVTFGNWCWHQPHSHLNFSTISSLLSIILRVQCACQDTFSFLTIHLFPHKHKFITKKNILESYVDIGTISWYDCLLNLRVIYIYYEGMWNTK